MHKGLLLALLLGSICVGFSLFTPHTFGLNAPAWRALGVTCFVAIGWVTEAMPIAAVSLVPAFAFPLLKVVPIERVAPSYSSPFVLLLLGGFFLALAVEHSGVHRRIALLLLLKLGGSPRAVVLGFGLAGTLVSMWISNTATALILLPVALALVDRAETKLPEGEGKTFGKAVILVIAYAASIGGMATPVGTPPNLIAIQALRKTLSDGTSISFFDWMAFGLPVVFLLTPIMVLFLIFVYPKVKRGLGFGFKAELKDELRNFGPWRSDEVRSLLLFVLTAILWITRAPLTFSDSFVIPGWQELLSVGEILPNGKFRSFVDDGVVALAFATLAFVIPKGGGKTGFLLDWNVARGAPWDLVLLFGGGVALSQGFDATGLSQRMGALFAWPSLGIELRLFLLVASMVFLTELMSNTALANLVMPVLALSAKPAGLSPEILVLPAALAASSGFMLPSSTGPNAVAYGTGRLTAREMALAGFGLNIVSGLVIWLVSVLFFAAKG